MAMAEAQNPGKKMMRKELSPDILMFNILPRLPMKSVCRFMCVSREWHSFLTTNHFAKMQLLHQNQDYNHQKLLLLSSTTPYNLCTIDCETPNKDGLSARRRPLPFVEVGSCKTIQISIVASLHGLVCIKRRCIDEEGHQYTYLILWNPLTSDYKTLSKRSSDDDCYHINYEGRFGLYYSTSDDDYKLLRVTSHPKVYIYSLKSDSWRNVTETTNTTSTSKWNSYFLTPGILLNDKLYFLKEKHIYGEYAPSNFIVMFDTRTEKLREIATPTLWAPMTECICFMVVRGSIHLCGAYADPQGIYYSMDLWRMNGSDGDWTYLVNYSPKECIWRREKPLHIMRNGDWLMYNCDHAHVLQRDINKHTFDIVFEFKSTHLNLGWKYMESLVSPNQYK